MIVRNIQQYIYVSQPTRRIKAQNTVITKVTVTEDFLQTETRYA